MDDLYQNPVYPYLPQNNVYRNAPSFDRSFHFSPLNDNNESEYDWSNHHYPVQTNRTSSNYGYYGSLSSTTHSSHSTSATNNLISNPPNTIPPRPKITTNVWEDEGTICYQIDAKGICVARRQDNDMINGTKLLNVVGMSRGKRDGILKNEKGRVVVKVGAMHLKGVWIPFNRARELATKFKIMDILFPLFVEEPSMYMCLPNDNTVVPPPQNDLMLPPSKIKNNNNINNNNNNNQRPDGYSTISVGIPNWDKTFNTTTTTTSTFDDHPPTASTNQLLHRSSQPDLSSINKSMHNNDFYLLNNNYYHQRQFNRSHSFSSFMYQEEEKRQLTDPYLKSSPYAINTMIKPETEINTKSAGSTTPSSWFSPETPTAVLFQKEDANKKRKSSLSIESSTMLSPNIRSTKKQKVLE